MNIKNISVIGLGKLGFPFAVCLANKGYKVTAVDINKSKIDLLKKGKTIFYEPGLNKLFHICRDRIRLTSDYSAAIVNSEATFIVVPTPSDKKGNFSTKYILEVLRNIGPLLKKKPDFHLVVLTSTVTPGSIDGEILPALESYSGKICGGDFGFCYSPEFIALGNVIHNLYNPDFVLIGESDARSGDILSSIYKRFCDNKPPIARMNFINAEVAKLALNTYVTTKISYANMLANLCELLPGANVDVVTRALGLDSRIGPKYLKGAVGYGGPCFPRDNSALLYAANKAGVEFPLAKASHLFNKHEIYRLAKIVMSKIPKKGKVGILGLAYKPDTDVVEEGQGILLAKLLLNKKIPVVLYDPIANKNARKSLSAKANFVLSKETCIRQSDVIVITTPWEEFKQISPLTFANRNKKRVLIDCWRILKPHRFKDMVEYIPIGICLPKQHL